MSENLSVKKITSHKFFFRNCQRCVRETEDISVLLGIFRTLTNIYDGVFYKYNQRLKTVTY